MSAPHYQTWAFDGVPFAVELGPAGSRLGGCMDHEIVEAVCDALIDGFVSEMDFDDLDDGLEDGCDLGSARFDPHSEYRYGGLVEYVRFGLTNDRHGDDETELSRLLGYVSEVDGRLVDHGLGLSDDGCGEGCDNAYSFVGFLLPEEVRRAVDLLNDVVFTDSYRDSDRQLLMRLLTAVSAKGLGFFRLWFP